jgi:hypothetical protein
MAGGWAGHMSQPGHNQKCLGLYFCIYSDCERCPSGVTSGTNEVSERSRDARVSQNTSDPIDPQSDAVYYSPS